MNVVVARLPCMGNAYHQLRRQIKDTLVETVVTEPHPERVRILMRFMANESAAWMSLRTIREILGWPDITHHPELIKIVTILMYDDDSKPVHEWLLDHERCIL